MDNLFGIQPRVLIVVACWLLVDQVPQTVNGVPFASSASSCYSATHFVAEFFVSYFLVAHCILARWNVAGWIENGWTIHRFSSSAENQHVVWVTLDIKRFLIFISFLYIIAILIVVFIRLETVILPEKKPMD